MVDHLALKAISNLLEKQISSATVAAALPHGQKVTMDKVIKLRVVADVSRGASDLKVPVEQPLDGYALLYVLEQEGVLPEGWRESMAGIFRQAVEVKKNKDGKFEEVFKEFRKSLHPVLPPIVQDRAAAILVKGNIIDFKEVAR